MNFKVTRNKDYCPSSGDHRHHKSSRCTCSSAGLEPDEYCPSHGYLDNRKCDHCQRFMKNKADPTPYMDCYDCGDCPQCEAVSR